MGRVSVISLTFKITEQDNYPTGTGTTDLARFKEVFLRLKQEGDAAPGAGGY